MIAALQNNALPPKFRAGSGVLERRIATGPVCSFVHVVESESNGTKDGFISFCGQTRKTTQTCAANRDQNRTDSPIMADVMTVL